jgi:Kef-type K+ transport system membrane component KefB
VFGEVLIGLILGPTMLDILAWPVFATLPSTGAAPLLDVVRDLAQIGVLLLLFVAGLETDLVMMRHVGKVAFWSALGGVVLPLICGTATAVAFGLPPWQGIFVGAILTATSVSISAQTLLEIGALRTREGSTILGAAVIDDVMGIIVLSLVVALARAANNGVDWSVIWIVLVRIAIYFGAVPLFFISIGLQANARELGPRAAFTVALVAVAVVAKAIGCAGLRNCPACLPRSRCASVSE